jgi:hypothetical protein
MITQDTTLDSDLLGCSDPAVTITGAEVALDLNGHIVDGDIVTPEQEGLQGHLAVRNGTVQGSIRIRPSEREILVAGVEAERMSINGAAAADVRNSQLRRLSFRSVASVTIHRNVVRGGGIELSLAGGTITDNLIEGYDGAGVLVLRGRAFLIGNTIRRNGVGVDSSFGRVTATNNRITENAHRGVAVSDAVIDFSHNVVSRNGTDGIRAQFSEGSLTDNTADGNGDDGIQLTDAFFTVSRNHVWWNGDLGIEVVQGDTRGGANWAKHNGNALQCVPGSLCSIKGKPKN